MAIENSVSNDFWSMFVDSVNIFDCRLPSVTGQADWIQPNKSLFSGNP